MEQALLVPGLDASWHAAKGFAGRSWVWTPSCDLWDLEALPIFPISKQISSTKR